mgnify:CR=1 FL=1
MRRASPNRAHYALAELEHAGAVNGLILPISLCCMLLACRNPKVVGKDYHHPMVLYIVGWVVVIFSAYLAITALPNLGKLFS